MYRTGTVFCVQKAFALLEINTGHNHNRGLLFVVNLRCSVVDPDPDGLGLLDLDPFINNQK